MDASLDHGVKDGDPVYVCRCHGRENQRWTVTHSVGGQSALVGIDGDCVDVRGAGDRALIVLDFCQDSPNQRWFLER